MKKSTSKLKLSRETIRALGEAPTRLAVGGASVAPRCTGLSNCIACAPTDNNEFSCLCTN
jgi:hypothetical protein